MSGRIPSDQNEEADSKAAKNRNESKDAQEDQNVDLGKVHDHVLANSGWGINGDGAISCL